MNVIILLIFDLVCYVDFVDKVVFLVDLCYVVCDIGFFYLINYGVDDVF